ncbi:calcium/sodium antiporter [Polynucleobacter acidiphobus]|uniref:calcium/sodium antiporter n=1 Tax=Polynucleobacter acidiphobus TaxID=556053 RepID=UPI000D3C5B48|nr:calcium/sodium antiporter [Polynucleobacter acidiphobus]
MTILYFCVGLVFLIIGANCLIRGASRIASFFGITPLVIGLTIVAFGTSAPELAVSAKAALSGVTDLAVGNVVGSNIFNILFILGSSALIAPLIVHYQIIRQEIPILIGLNTLLFAFIIDEALTMPEALLLLTLLASYTIFLIWQSKKESTQAQDMYAKELAIRSPVKKDSSLWMSIFLVVAGLFLLVLGSDWFVNASIAIAKAIGVSDIVIGLTIVAAGTSMPEVATSIIAALKGERDIAVGNVIGSNIFNILGCLGVIGILAPSGIQVPPSVVNFDLWVMLAVSLACIPIFVSGRQIARWEGGLFIFYYCAYVTYLVLASKEHDALPTYSATMLSFVLPLTIVTLMVMMLGKSSKDSG